MTPAPVWALDYSGHRVRLVLQIEDEFSEDGMLPNRIWDLPLSAPDAAVSS